MQTVNLKKELEKEQQIIKQRTLVDEAKSILFRDSNEDKTIAKRIKFSKQIGDVNLPNLERLDSDRMFDLAAINQLCIKYRLRFLSSDLFAGDVPKEAVHATRHIEAESGLKFSKFHIVAPAERFNLKDSTKDPMLLAELPNGKFYYIFQWGDDMSWYQSILKYPMRHIGTLSVCAILFGAAVAAIMPRQFEQFQPEFFYRFFLFSMTSALVLTLVIITGIMHSKDFSENVWNSKFLK